jgi:hypothetical protein
MNIHAVFVGIDQYQDVRIPSLRCAARDALSICGIFESIGASVDLLVNNRATAVGIRRSLTSLARGVDEDDTAIFYFSGHGAMEHLKPRSSNPQYVPLLLPYDTVQDDLMATAIQIEEIGRFLGMITCRNVLFLFDSCYSGTAANTRSFPIPGMRATEKGIEMMPRIAGEGTVVLAACGEYEPAYEDPASGHGIFTEFILEGLSGRASTGLGTVTVGSLYDYVAREVPGKTENLFNGYRQRPIKHGHERVPIQFPVMQRCAVKSLVNFPYDFLPITVVIGDRREPDYKTIGDVFAYSASPAELRWLLRLGLPQDTEIISDKVFLEAQDDFLVERYGSTNLLVIGSPAANLVARAANETAFFPFAVDLGTREQWHKVYGELRALRGQRTKLVNYASDPRTSDLRRYYLNQYRKGGLIDPTYTCVKRGETVPSDKDYGVVTICRNPYARGPGDATHCVMAAGVHLPGTMHALNLLTKAKVEFTERPLGGVFTVTLTEGDWVKRIVTGRLGWSTEPYDLNHFRECLVTLKTSERLRYVEGEITAQDVDLRIDLLDQMCQKSRIT